MNTVVGIDVSKGKSVVAAMRPFGEVALPPREFLHTNKGLSMLTEALRLIDGDTRVILAQACKARRKGVAQGKLCGVLSAMIQNFKKVYTNRAKRGILYCVYHTEFCAQRVEQRIFAAPPPQNVGFLYSTGQNCDSIPV